MNWTTPADIRNYVQKCWDRGELLTSLAAGELFDPIKVPLKGPSSSDMSSNYGKTIDWIRQLIESSQHYRMVFKNINHRVLGTNEIPTELWIDTLDDALAIVGKRKAAAQFEMILEQTRRDQPALLQWLARRPLHALELAKDWPNLLALISWLQAHPRPNIYLRQIDLSGIHTKWIEGYRGVLSELLDLALPPEAIDHRYKGAQGFCRRYGFLDKPLHVRFRMLDPQQEQLSFSADQDLTVTAETFSNLHLDVSNIFITENEINFLSFPRLHDALVIFGAGYGFESIKNAIWLSDKKIYYWGDIDTHGFAILNQLRGLHPQVISLLMDQHTLMAHRELWGQESTPEMRDLGRLTQDEKIIYDYLRGNYWGDHIRLEQERIGFHFVQNSLDSILKE